MRKITIVQNFFNDIDNNLITEFKKFCETKNWFFDDYTSEFTIQFRLCRFLDFLYTSNIIELESNIERYGYTALIKKEIDIDIRSDSGIRTAIELKFIRDQGSYNIGMYKFCEDIKFLEQLTELEFHKGLSIVFTNIKELYTKPNKPINPKNKENLHLYNCFRNEFKLKGEIKIKTGNFNDSLTLKGEYDLNWIDFTNYIKVCVIEVY